MQKNFKADETYLSRNYSSTIEITIILFIVSSVALDLISWKCRKATLIIMYLEFAWITFDSIFVLQRASDEGHA